MMLAGDSASSHSHGHATRNRDARGWRGSSHVLVAREDHLLLTVAASLNSSLDQLLTGGRCLWRARLVVRRHRLRGSPHVGGATYHLPNIGAVAYHLLLLHTNACHARRRRSAGRLLCLGAGGDVSTGR